MLCLVCYCSALGDWLVSRRQNIEEKYGHVVPTLDVSLTTTLIEGTSFRHWNIYICIWAHVPACALVLLLSSTAWQAPYRQEAGLLSTGASSVRGKHRGSRTGSQECRLRQQPDWQGSRERRRIFRIYFQRCKGTEIVRNMWNEFFHHVKWIISLIFLHLLGFLFVSIIPQKL